MWHRQPWHETPGMPWGGRHEAGWHETRQSRGGCKKKYLRGHEIRAALCDGACWVQPRGASEGRLQATRPTGGTHCSPKHRGVPRRVWVAYPATEHLQPRGHCPTKRLASHGGKNIHGRTMSDQPRAEIPLGGGKKKVKRGERCRWCSQEATADRRCHGNTWTPGRQSDSRRLGHQRLQLQNPAHYVVVWWPKSGA